MLETFLTKFLAPILVSAVVTLIFNREAEGQRAKRDYQASQIDDIRSDVLTVALMAVDYHSCGQPNARTQHWAELAIREADLRASVAGLLNETATSVGKLGDVVNAAHIRFIDAVTGGSFGADAAERDDDQIRRIIGASTSLRRELRKLRIMRMDEARRFPWQWVATYLLLTIGLIIFALSFSA